MCIRDRSSVGFFGGVKSCKECIGRSSVYDSVFSASNPFFVHRVFHISKYKNICFFFARLKSYLQVMRADRSPAACNRVLRLIIYYMDRIFRVLHATGWQHITGHLRIME